MDSHSDTGLECLLLKAFFMLPFMALLVASAHAQVPGGFAGGVTPSRLEMIADAGETVARSLSIYNLGQRPQKFGVQTNEWTFSDSGEIAFSDELAENSCRPWVRLERRKINVVPSATRARKFRFEVHVPADAGPTECRFAIMIESLGEPYNAEINGGAITLPTTGRIAVIVYLAVAGAKPDIAVSEVKVMKVGKSALPFVSVSNKGNAHGRLDSALDGVDAKGNKLELFVATSPILAGQTRLLALSPDEKYRQDVAEIIYPLKLSGKIYADSATFSIDTVLTH